MAGDLALIGPYTWDLLLPQLSSALAAYGLSDRPVKYGFGKDVDFRLALTVAQALKFPLNGSWRTYRHRPATNGTPWATSKSSSRWRRRSRCAFRLTR